MEDIDDIVEPMTIDDLGRMIVEGFAEQRQFFREEMEEMRQDLRGEFNPRFDLLEHKVDALRLDMGTTTHDVKHLKGRMENLEMHSFGSIQAA